MNNPDSSLDPALKGFTTVYDEASEVDDGIDRSPQPLRLSHILVRLRCLLLGHKWGQYGTTCVRCGEVLRAD